MHFCILSSLLHVLASIFQSVNIYLRQIYAFLHMIGQSSRPPHPLLAPASAPRRAKAIDARPPAAPRAQPRRFMAPIAPGMRNNRSFGSPKIENLARAEQ
jgi:hypothetical protein